MGNHSNVTHAVTQIWGQCPYKDGEGSSKLNVRGCGLFPDVHERISNRAKTLLSSVAREQGKTQSELYREVYMTALDGLAAWLILQGFSRNMVLDKLVFATTSGLMTKAMIVALHIQAREASH